MNANELASELEEGAKRAEDHATIAKRVAKAATMLRAQQAEIEALKMDIHSLTYGERLAEYLKKAQEK